jgi:hypothetical protein
MSYYLPVRPPGCSLGWFVRHFKAFSYEIADASKATDAFCVMQDHVELDLRALHIIAYDVT